MVPAEAWVVQAVVFPVRQLHLTPVLVPVAVLSAQAQVAVLVAA